MNNQQLRSIISPISSFCHHFIGMLAWEHLYISYRKYRITSILGILDCCFFSKQIQSRMCRHPRETSEFLSTKDKPEWYICKGDGNVSSTITFNSYISGVLNFASKLCWRFGDCIDFHFVSSKIMRCWGGFMLFYMVQQNHGAYFYCKNRLHNFCNKYFIHWSCFDRR
jgi:hypothetical protein